MKNKNIKYFNYVSVDFLIDKDGIPVFMEVNDNTLAPYYIEQKNLIAQKALAGSSRLVNLNVRHKNVLLSCFDEFFKKSQEASENNKKKIAIICKRRDHPSAIDKEIRYLVELFQQNGYDAEMYVPEDFEVKEDCLFIKKDNSCPSVIFRRNFSFPPANVKQPVVNDLRVRSIAGNKYLTHKIVEQLIRSGQADIRQPRTYLVKDSASLAAAIEKFFEKNIDCIAKPNRSYGGDGFFCFERSESMKVGSIQEKIEVMAKRMETGEEYLVQEKIESSLFRSVNNQEYYFDIRLMIYGGQFAGIEGRRSNYPFNRKRIDEKSLVTNIKSGGVDLLVLSTMDEHCHYESRQLVPVDKIADSNFEIDPNFLILGSQLFSRIKRASEAIVQIIDETISTSEEKVYG